MDIQMKKGLLEACILRVVEDEPSYGYKIIGDISKYIEVSESTLYPILKRLETATCLNTFTKEYNGRLRKYYEITATGMQRIQYFKEEWPQIKNVYEFILKEKFEPKPPEKIATIEVLNNTSKENNQNNN